MAFAKKWIWTGLGVGLILTIGACGSDGSNQAISGTGGATSAISTRGGAGGTVTTTSTQTTTGGTTTTTTTPKAGQDSTAKGGKGGGAAGKAGTSGKGGGGPAGNTSQAGKGGSTGDDTASGVPADHCLAKSPADYFADGPFTYKTRNVGAVNMYIPDVPAGCKVPMIHLSNGTGGNCLYYGGILVRLASHGFVALCYENTNTGAGTFCMDSYEAALQEAAEVIDVNRIGSTGHSQGGMAAINCVARIETKYGLGADKIYAGFAIEPASGFGTNPIEGYQTLYAQIKSPMFMFSGLGTDTLVSQGWVQSAFDTMSPTTEVYFWTKSGANHIATSTPDTNEVVIPWFRWKLLGDEKACEVFKAIPTTNTTWAVAAVKNEKPCK